MIECIDELIDLANKLETVQLEIKRCNDFLEKYAARKTPYMSIQFYRDEIERIKETMELDWENQVKVLEDVIEQQQAIKDAVEKELVGVMEENKNNTIDQNIYRIGYEDPELITILNYWKGFKDQFEMFKDQISNGDFS